MRRGASSWCALLLSFLSALAWARPPEKLEADERGWNSPARARSTLAAGGSHTLSLAEDGTVWAWGDNGLGAVGDGTFAPRPDPIQVPGLSGIISVAAGNNHSLALGADGRVWSWGYNIHGQLGMGHQNTVQATPLLVPGLTDVVSIAATTDYSLALRADGSVWGWGSNSSDLLGFDPSRSDVFAPRQIPGLSSVFVTAIAAGQQHALALSREGTVWAWGDNYYGALGREDRYNSRQPAPVLGLTDVVALAAGKAHSLALLRQGTVMAWGSGRRGELGIGQGAPEAQFTPVPVPGLTHVRALATRHQSNLALRRDGTVWRWGLPSMSILTQGSSEPLYAPAPLPGLSDVVNIELGYEHGMARRHDGSVWGWGSDYAGAVGRGSIHRPTPVALPGLQGVRTSSIGASLVLALRTDGSVWSWGLQPAPVQGFSDAVAVASVEGSSFIVRADGSLWAWGSNASGQLGDGTRVSRSTPQAVPGLTNIVAVSGGGNGAHVLALSGDGQVWAWGSNTYYGQLGDGTTTDRLSPVLVPGLTDIVAISAGPNFSLALGRDGQVWAWGRNDMRQLGDETTTHRLSPVLVPGLTDVVALGTGAGASHSLALRADGTLWGWGYNVYGQIDPTLPRNYLSHPVPITGMTQVTGMAVGSAHSLALRGDGSVWSWGSNSMSQLGRRLQSGEDTRALPAPIAGLSGVVSVSSGWGTSHAVLGDGTVRAWGSNRPSPIGDGVSSIISSPELVLPPRQHCPH